MNLRHLPESVDEARLLPHLRSRAVLEQRVTLEHQQRTIFRREYERAVAEGKRPVAAKRNEGVMIDPRELRGIPIVGKGVGGVSPGTQPEGNLILRHGEWRAA